MNTYTIPFSAPALSTVKRPALASLVPSKITAKLVKWSLAGSVALAVVIAAAWAATSPAIAGFLAASLWASGFIFFVLAMEVDIKRVLPYIATGLTLPVLALLGTHLAVEFSFLGALLVAGWAAMWIGRRA